LPIAPSSYHVTVWDGINADNIGYVNPAVRTAWSVFLTGLAPSLKAPPNSMEVVTRSALRNWSGSISFQFEKLTLWGNQVLVARLQPVEGASERNLTELSALREQMSEAARSKLGVDFSRSYSPHVTLGYFANQEHAQSTHPC
jgi:hypothetical protein